MTLRDAIAPLHFVSKLSGLTLFSIDYSNYATRFSKFDFVFIIIATICSYYLNLYFWKFFNFSNYHQSEIVNKIMPILIYGKFVINVLAFVWSTASREKIGKLLKILVDVDELVSLIWSCLNVKHSTF